MFLNSKLIKQPNDEIIKKLKQIYSENLELLSGIDLSYEEYENEIKRYNDSVSKINEKTSLQKVFEGDAL